MARLMICETASTVSADVGMVSPRSSEGGFEETCQRHVRVRVLSVCSSCLCRGSAETRERRGNAVVAITWLRHHAPTRVGSADSGFCSWRFRGRRGDGLRWARFAVEELGAYLDAHGDLAHAVDPTVLDRGSVLLDVVHLCSSLCVRGRGHRPRATRPPPTLRGPGHGVLLRSGRDQSLVVVQRSLRSSASSSSSATTNACSMSTAWISRSWVSCFVARTTGIRSSWVPLVSSR